MLRVLFVYAVGGPFKGYIGGRGVCVKSAQPWHSQEGKDKRRRWREEDVSGRFDDDYDENNNDDGYGRVHEDERWCRQQLMMTKILTTSMLSLGVSAVKTR